VVQEYYDEIATLGLPMTNDGKQNPAFIGALGGFIPKGAKNVTVAKEFMKYVIQPKVMNAYLKEGLGRWLPAFPSLVKSDPFWLDPKDPHRPVYVREGLLEPTVVNYYVFNPGVGVVNARQIWGAAEADVIRNGKTPQQATEDAFKKVQAILAQYPVQQA
jgi:multiple sugar transport system substrate-binding protein